MTGVLLIQGTFLEVEGAQWELELSERQMEGRNEGRKEGRKEGGGAGEERERG